MFLKETWKVFSHCFLECIFCSFVFILFSCSSHYVYMRIFEKFLEDMYYEKSLHGFQIFLVLELTCTLNLFSYEIFFFLICQMVLAITGRRHRDRGKGRKQSAFGAWSCHSCFSSISLSRQNFGYTCTHVHPAFQVIESEFKPCSQWRGIWLNPQAAEPWAFWNPLIFVCLMVFHTSLRLCSLFIFLCIFRVV